VHVNIFGWEKLRVEQREIWITVVLKSSDFWNFSSTIHGAYVRFEIKVKGMLKFVLFLLHSQYFCCGEWRGEKRRKLEPRCRGDNRVFRFNHRVTWPYPKKPLLFILMQANTYRYQENYHQKHNIIWRRKSWEKDHFRVKSRNGRKWLVYFSEFQIQFVCVALCPPPIVYLWVRATVRCLLPRRDAGCHATLSGISSASKQTPPPFLGLD